jgi:hypothetical protein
LPRPPAAPRGGATGHRGQPAASDCVPHPLALRLGLTDLTGSRAWILRAWILPRPPRMPRGAGQCRPATSRFRRETGSRSHRGAGIGPENVTDQPPTRSAQRTRPPREPRQEACEPASGAERSSPAYAVGAGDPSSVRSDTARGRGSAPLAGSPKHPTFPPEWYPDRIRGAVATKRLNANLLISRRIHAQLPLPGSRAKICESTAVWGPSSGSGCSTLVWPGMEANATAPQIVNAINTLS